MEQQSTEQPKMAEPIKYNVQDAKIAEMKEAAKDIKVTNPKERKISANKIAECRDLRVSVEKRRKELKSDALEFGKKVDAEATRIKDLLLDVETPLKEIQQAYDDEQQRIKDEKERIERERVEEIQVRLSDIKNYIPNSVGKNSETIKGNIDFLLNAEITEEIFQEFTEEAKMLKDAVISKLEEMHKTVLETEQEAIRLEEERKEQAIQAERLAEERRLFEEQQAKIAAENKIKQDKIDAENKANKDAEDKRIADERKKMQEEQEAKDKELADRKAELDAKEAKIAADEAKAAHNSSVNIGSGGTGVQFKAGVGTTQKPIGAPPAPQPNEENNNLINELTDTRDLMAATSSLLIEHGIKEHGKELCDYAFAVDAWITDLKKDGE